MLTERQLEVVLSVVYEYIKSGESVGSRTLSRRYLTGHSSATIRNEMSDLEEMGYLKQPHTSAGRIPTTQGYRLYVDTVLQRRESLTPSVDWTKLLRDHREGIEGALESATEILSKISNYVGIAAITTIDDIKFQKVDFVRMGERVVLLLVVLNGGLVHQKIINLPWDMSQDALDDLSRRVNFFAGSSWNEVKQSIMEYIMGELSSYKNSCEVALKELEGVILTPSVKVFTGSKSHMFNLPDFQDLSKIQALFSFLEEERSITDLISSCSIDGMNVLIGEENEILEMKNSSLVATTSISNGQKALIGVIGPDRMDYENVISAIDKVLQVLGLDSEGEFK
ncbi:MAG: heat-inducible transcriptional repressor HrcA [Synergistaceae bacterium]